MGTDPGAFGMLAQHHRLIVQKQAQMAQQLLQRGLPHGGHWQAFAALQGNPYQAPHPGYGGAGFPGLAQLAALQAAVQETFDEPVENAGIRAGEIRAWRCWCIECGMLRSMVVPTVWVPGVPMKGVPGKYVLGGGVHAWKTEGKALAYARGFSWAAVVVGQVELWGDITEHEEGYRAEYGEIVSLDRLIEPWGLFQQPRRRRGWLRRLILGADPEPECPLVRLRCEYGLSEAA